MCKGRLFNVLGQPIDNLGPVNATEHWPIHRKPPAFEEQSTVTEIFETGFKVVDLLCPYPKGGKVALFGGAGVGKTVLLLESSAISPPSTAAPPCFAAWENARAKGTTCTAK